MVTSTPLTMRAVPNTTENAVVSIGDPLCVASSSRRKRAEARHHEPNPIRAMPVRIHARNVRSSAR